VVAELGGFDPPVQVQADASPVEVAPQQTPQPVRIYQRFGDADA
jgi:hypothetical protein